MTGAFPGRWRRPALLAAVALAADAGPAAAVEAWHVPAADLRCTFDVDRAPDTASAGVLAVLPDGGLLPGPPPEPVVTDCDGKPLKCETVWQNPAEALGVVFETRPAGSRVLVYVRRGTGAGLRREPSGLTPGLFLHTRTGNASLEAAYDLGRNTPPGPNAIMGAVERIGQRENPFGGDDDYVSYYTGWLKAEPPGRTYFCTVSDEGSECRLDGRVVASWPGLHPREEGRKGQYGTWTELAPGLHRVEYYHFDEQGAQEANLCWRTPKDRPNALPSTIPPSAYVQSGTSRLRRVEFRDGRPPAVIEADCQSYLWAGDAPLVLFVLSAPFTPTNATCAWMFDGGLQATGDRLGWLCEGPFPRTVTLTVGSSEGTSRSTRALDVRRTPRAASPNNANDRRVYRDALLARCRAVPEPKRPCAGWSADLWAALVAVVEPFKAKALLLEVFNRSRQDVLALDEAARRVLEDAFFEVVRYTDPQAADGWLTRLEQEERDPERRMRWKFARVDYCLYDRDDAAAARRLVGQLRSQAARPEDAIRATVREGDIERLAGRYDAARALYASAQERYLETTRDAQRRAAQTNVLAGTRRDAAGSAPSGAAGLQAVAEAWKQEAVREASFYATVKNQLAQGFLGEAWTTLQQWELELPLSKLGGDYPLAEAEYFMAVGVYGRALRLLTVYRGGVDITSHLPRAMELELECLRSLNREAEARELARDIVRRFPSHPIAEKAKPWL